MFKNINSQTVKTQKIKLSDAEKNIIFPIRIIGTKKPWNPFFYSVDSFVSLMVDRQHPYLYLTFEDKNGAILGPVRYNSKLTGFGVIAGLGLNFQMGAIRGDYKRVYFNEIPKRIDVKGGNLAFSTTLCTGFHSTRLTMKDVEQLQFRYFGTSLLSALGYAKIPYGFFEAEPYLYNKVNPMKEKTRIDTVHSLDDPLYHNQLCTCRCYHGLYR